ncbi:Histone H4 acetyltransferase NuA4 complex Eaf6 [Macrophomina phaseolina MS6]|uniref:Chromatin modification-related protein EAF6 n=1 Tax=Macrophomina phaseolina (strain MS6) TaxID=1126212 RepID=K2RHN9_MACPH|nr:Histone H4 acetyltransferase NuA4 complex Eaf6 [Macrophomina phaseolina MS6]
MAENAPPADAQANASSEATRGMPYYEKLRRDLREALAKKRVLDAALNTIEENIFRAESSYLEETSAGNIVKGFDNYIKGSTTSTSGGAAASNAARRKAAINDQDRIFSRSSQSFILNVRALCTIFQSFQCMLVPLLTFARIPRTDGKKDSNS